MKRLIQLQIVTGCGVLMCLVGCKGKPKATAPPPLVEVATVTQSDVPIYHEWIGVLDGLVNAQIRAQVTSATPELPATGF